MHELQKGSSYAVHDMRCGRVNEIRTGRRGACTRWRRVKSERAVLTPIPIPIPSARYSCRPAAMAVPLPWPLSAGRGHAMCARELPWPRPPRARAHRTWRLEASIPFRRIPTISEPTVSSTAVLVLLRDTPICYSPYLAYGRVATGKAGFGC